LQLLFDRILLLKRVPFFALLRTDQLRHIVPMLEPAGWASGECVLEKGDPSDCLDMVLSGRVGIVLHDDPESTEYVAHLKQGDCFGEMGLLDDLPRSATAYVLETVEALSLSRVRLHGMLKAYPELGIGMLAALSGRLREANDARIKSGYVTGDLK